MTEASVWVILMSASFLTVREFHTSFFLPSQRHAPNCLGSSSWVFLEEATMSHQPLTHELLSALKSESFGDFLAWSREVWPCIGKQACRNSGKLSKMSTSLPAAQKGVGGSYPNKGLKRCVAVARISSLTQLSQWQL